jgi:hypothetical protein
MIMALPMGGGGVSTQDTRAHPECLSSTTRLVWEVSPGGYYAGPSYAVMSRALGECATPPVAPPQRSPVDSNSESESPSPAPFIDL